MFYWAIFFKIGKPVFKKDKKQFIYFISSN